VQQCETNEIARTMRMTIARTERHAQKVNTCKNSDAELSA
jgi:hypothetical protein